MREPCDPLSSALLVLLGRLTFTQGYVKKVVHKISLRSTRGLWSAIPKFNGVRRTRAIIASWSAPVGGCPTFGVDIGASAERTWQQF